MKKIIGLALAFMLMFTACGGTEAQEKYPPQKMDFGDGNYSWHYYDDRGVRTKYEVFRDDVLTEIHYFEYDADGNVIKNTITDAEGNETKRTETTYKNSVRDYSATFNDGHIAIECWYAEDGEREVLNKYYDDNGQLEEWNESLYDEELGDFTLFHRADDTIYLMHEYTEDENGRFVTISTYYDENEEIEKIVERTNTANGYKDEILFDRDRG